MNFEQDIENALVALRAGGTILYPTDTIWGLGCDATNEKAVADIYRIKQRDDSKALIILVADEREIMQYVAAPDPAAFIFLEQQAKPTTMIFDGAIGLAENLVASDGSIAIRICHDSYCRHLLRRLRKPLVSTSANRSGQPSPQVYGDISKEIVGAVDYVAYHRRDEMTPASPSAIYRWKDGEALVIRP